MTGKTIKFSKKRLFSVLGILILGCITVISVDFHNNGHFMEMLIHSVGSIINKTDASSAAHLKDMYEPMAIVIKSPFWGLGFGNNGPLALKFSSSALAVESSYYLMMYEEGIIFGLLFFLPYFLVIKKGIKEKNKGYMVSFFVCIAIVITYIFLPNCQIFEILFYSYVFIGLYSNKSLKSLSV